MVLQRRSLLSRRVDDEARRAARGVSASRTRRAVARLGSGRSQSLHQHRQSGNNIEVTANGLLTLLHVIADCKAYSKNACDEMLQILLDQQYRGGIPAGLPKAARVAHKTGNISTVHHDAGIVFLEDRKPYVL